MYDAIVVGARCAGAALAMLLSRRGARVLLLDRATFPSDIPHGHFIHRHGPRRLRDWGLLESVAARTPAVSSMIFDIGDFPLLARDLVEDGLPWGYGPRRTTLDKILIDAAMESGAEFRQGFTVSDYLFDAGRLVGIRGHEAKGPEIEERATITIGADGRHSRLARTVRAATYNEVPTLTGYYFSYYSGVEAEPFELYLLHARRRVILSFRTEDDLFAIFVSYPIDELDRFRRDIDAAFTETLRLVPDFAARVAAGRREERFYGATDLPNFYRKPFGPGWALVGDAVLHKDPLLALGICDAWRDAEILATAIIEGMGGRLPLEEALSGYERERDAASATDYEENIVGARFTPPPPQVFALRAAIKNTPEEATRFVKARMHMTDPAGFFNPQNMQRLLSLAMG